MTCRSSDVRDPRSGYQVAFFGTSVYLKATEICLPKRCEENDSAEGKKSLLEEVGSKA